ncbi:MAG TPA: diacylglycerol kinase family protein [Syntrophothermus lipocalidus]|uniref:Diacylglycerol kinase n=1 Tax=Syntrophothermus lipocalidus (strain DSM 12680 / TGB-C1) TaxID=643648 RepID=D7CNW1_SYNLT|nr:diacylglycerol kinase family protein [Syntrophothermus lipocalidus]ADI02396.1 diacylglycerol kinase [Syntrophothermus lipocalidus DSM 12680]HHV77784.1 diacylglycerol kinase family protein [Syntrophothermus lipocalidus]HOV43089.1 diacylglycerol kinase family protein [Syntrophothermus lipocalidus]
MKNRNLKESFNCAWAGIISAFLTQRNMRWHGLAAVAAVTLGWALHIERWEWGLLSFTIFLVLIAEVMNTAVEKTVDLYTDAYHPVAREAKNIAAGAVLLAAVAAVVTGIIIFGPRFIDYLS